MQDRKEVFGALDGMRFVAAVAVVVFHADFLFPPNALGGAFLAVDLFFCLSGFVIAHSYGGKIKSGMPFKTFLKIRLIRLYPLYSMALIPAAGLMFLSVVFGHGQILSFAAMIVTGIAFLPNPFSRTLYPLNGPAWSLFFELVVNLAFAIIWRRWGARLLIAIMTVSAAGLIMSGVLTGTIDGGYYWSGFYLGLLRVTFSFSAGVLVYQYRNHFTKRVPSIILFLIAIAVFTWGADFGALSQLVSVLVIFPLLVAGGTATDSPFANLYSLGGRLSYGVYVFHLPLLAVVQQVISRTGLSAHPPYGGLLFIAGLIAWCWVADRYLDVPCRALLRSILIPLPPPSECDEEDAGPLNQIAPPQSSRF